MTTMTGKSVARAAMGSTNADDHGEHHHHDEIDTTPHQHAFFFVGTERLFLVHMGNMWMAPHRYQMVLEIDVDDATRRRILDVQSQAPDAWYIIGNEATSKFNIPELALQVGRTFEASLWKEFPSTQPPPGEHWPWASEPPLYGNFQVTVRRVVHFRALDFNMKFPETATYFLFGAGSEAHLCHLFTRQPDYDHVLSLDRAPEWLPQPYLGAGVFVNFPSIPAVPDGPVAVYTADPLGGAGERQVHVGGLAPARAITLARKAFFGTFPINETDPAGGPRRIWSGEGK
jgi:hypothetical protein